MHSLPPTLARALVIFGLLAGSQHVAQGQTKSASEILLSGKPDAGPKMSDDVNPADSSVPAAKSADSKETATDVADTPVTKPTAKPKKAKMEAATFGAGCFWSAESVFERLPGVKSVVSGFSGGDVAYPSYEMVCTGETGHAEVIEVNYDPSVVSYEELLKVFFAIHDPTTLNRQGDDYGTQYRSAIYFHNEAQKQAALKYYKQLTADKAFRSPIVTELTKFTKFYPAENYHQDYFDNNPDSQYSEYYIIPKLAKLGPKFHLNLK